MFLLVPAYPACPGSKAVKRSLLSVDDNTVMMDCIRTDFPIVHTSFVDPILQTMLDTTD